MSRPNDYRRDRPTRLFFPPDPADVDYDPAPRYGHFCTGPNCGTCDDIAEASWAEDARPCRYCFGSGLDADNCECDECGGEGVRS